MDRETGRRDVDVERLKAPQKPELGLPQRHCAEANKNKRRDGSPFGSIFFVFSFVFVFHFLPPEPHLKDVAWYYPYLPLPHTVLLVRVCVSLFILFHTQLRGPQTWVLASPSDGFKQVAHGASSRETHSPVWELKKKKKKKSWSEVVSACVLAFCVVSILWRSTIFWSASLNPYVKRRTQRNYPEKIMYYVCIFILFDFHMLNNIYL